MRRLRRGRGSSVSALVWSMCWACRALAYFGCLGDGFTEDLDFEVAMGGVELCVRVNDNSREQERVAHRDRHGCTCRVDGERNRTTQSKSGRFHHRLPPSAISLCGRAGLSTPSTAFSSGRSEAEIARLINLSYFLIGYSPYSIS